jgi:Tol biopolymer transport system component
MVPVWTPDSERIAYAAGSKGQDSLHWTRADGSGSSELLVTNPRTLVPGAWTPDGRALLYYVIPAEAVTAAEAGPGLWAQDVTNKSAPRALARSVTRAGGVDVSPDGRWIAYQSNESGQVEVYVDAYPGPGPRFQVSTDGGASPIWRADGRELFYVRPTAGARPLQAGEVEVSIMAVAVTTQPKLTFGTPRQLFVGRYSMNAPARGYDVTGDGQRFLMLQARERAPDVVTAMTVVQNWITELK